MEDQIEDVRSVVEALRKFKSYSIMTKNWKAFSFNLGVDQLYIDDLEKRQLLRIVQPNEILPEILRIWIADQGTNATWNVLFEAVIHSCPEMQDVAESLLEKYWTPESMRKVKFEWQGNVTTLEQLLGESTSNDSHQKIFKTLRMSRVTSKQSFQNPIQLLKEQLTPPSQPKYYIPRTLLYISSTGFELHSKLFTSEIANDDVFLFKGISKPELVKISGYQAIDESVNQLHKVTVRFIILECDEDFDRICKSTSRPVHLIRHEGGRFLWEKSDKGMDLIKAFLKGERKPIDEQELASMITSQYTFSALSIADSPGMGKTLMLANLAKELRIRQPNNFFLFIVLQEFVLRLGPVDSKTSALEAIVEYSSSDSTVKPLLMEIFNRHEILLLLDGYDEVMQDKLNLFDSFLKHLHEQTHVRLIITTRPHLRSRLEMITKQFSFEMLPFNETNQIDFLTKYWTDQYGAKEGPTLKQFAKQCVTLLETELTDNDKEIAGIPLQCMMLAEVYAEDAGRASNMDILKHDSAKPISLFQMYQKLIELKFTRIGPTAIKTAFLHVHVFVAVKLLFPEWIEIFKPLLNVNDEVYDKNALYSAGVMEQSPNMNAPRFIHRTFAEYLLAEFIVKNLGKNTDCVSFLFGEILGRKGTERMAYSTSKMRADADGYSFHYTLKYPVICYFIEYHINEYSKHHPIKMLLPSKLSRLFGKTKFNVKDVCVTAKVCCINDLEVTFDYATKVLHKYRIPGSTRDEYFRGLPHLVTYSSKNVTMLKKLLEFVNSKFGVDWKYHTFEEWDFTNRFSISNCTPLHSAIRMGKYNMVSFLVQHFGDQVKKLTCLLHTCVLESARQSKSDLEDRLLIIDLLVKTNPAWLEEQDLNDLPALLEPQVDLSLIKHLVQHGADINAYSQVAGTVLHTASTKETYTELVQWALSNGFELINHTDIFGRTPLMHAIKECGTVENEVLKMFKEAGVDFNKAPDREGNAVLFYAIMYSDDVDFIRKLLECGANINHLNKWKENAVHRLLWASSAFNEKQILMALKLLESKGFKGFNEKDSNGETPLEVARRVRTRDEEVYAFLLARAS